jgi:membrane fusion protein, multidrug efflux system
MRIRNAYRRRIMVRVFALLAAGLAMSYAQAEAQQQAAPPPPPVTVAQPVERKVAEWDEFTGRFQAVDMVEVRARVSGYLTEIHFIDGQMVKTGDLLFVIDPRPFERIAERLRAELAAAKARFEFAQKDLERARPLAKNETISEQVFQQRQRELAETEATVKASEAALGAAELNVEFTRVTAPLAGRISRKLVSIGNYVTGASEGATLLTTIVSQDPIQFYFDISEADYLKYLRLGKAGTGASYRENPTPVVLGLMDEKGFPHPGALDFVENRIDAATGSLRGRAVFKNPGNLFTPGLFARIRLAGSGEYQAMLLPDGAIATDQTNRFVYTVGEDGAVAYKPVTLGPIIDGLRVIRSGVTASDWVIVNGIQRARPGGKVTPQRSTIDAQAQAAALR